MQCGICNGEALADHNRPPETLKEAEREARKMGWQKTKRYGWICDRHSDAKEGES